MSSLSKWRSHLQGYTEEKVQKFRQLESVFSMSQKDSKNWAGREIVCDRKFSKCDRDVFRITMTKEYVICITSSWRMPCRSPHPSLFPSLDRKLVPLAQAACPSITLFSVFSPQVEAPINRADFVVGSGTRYSAWREAVIVEHSYIDNGLTTVCRQWVCMSSTRLCMGYM